MNSLQKVLVVVVAAVVISGADAWFRPRPVSTIYNWNRVVFDNGTTGREYAKTWSNNQLVLSIPPSNSVFNRSYILEDYQAGQLAIKVPTTRGWYCFIYNTNFAYNDVVEELRTRQSAGTPVELGEAPDYIAEGKIDRQTLYQSSRSLYRFCYFAFWTGNVYQLYDETLEEFETTVYEGFSWPVVGLFAPYNILLSTTIPIPPEKLFPWQQQSAAAQQSSDEGFTP